MIANKLVIREILLSEYDALGNLTIDVYSQLPEMPSKEVMPDYYGLLKNVKARANTPTVKIFSAYDEQNKMLGGVIFIGDMAYYGSGGSATTLKKSAGFRLLVVAPSAQGMGVGRALTEFYIEQAKLLAVEYLVMHTTKSMAVAWKIYQKMGFKPFPEIDFDQSGLAVYGFRRAIVKQE